LTKRAGEQEDSVLNDGRVATRIPVQDLNRAREFYADKLGLQPSEERPGGLLDRCATDSEGNMLGIGQAIR
jgi:catechol 2,3-dioxygenase-like lactoylglutathione lyase family enzyme